MSFFWTLKDLRCSFSLWLILAVSFHSPPPTLPFQNIDETHFQLINSREAEEWKAEPLHFGHPSVLLLNFATVECSLKEMGGRKTVVH